MKQAIDKLENQLKVFKNSKTTPVDVGVSYYCLREILLADLAWKESVEKRIDELEMSNKLHIQNHHSDPCKPSVPENQDPLKGLKKYRFSGNPPTQELVTVEDEELASEVHDCICGGYSIHTARKIVALVRSHTKDMVSIPRSVAQEVIDKGYELPNELYDAIKQSLKGQV